MGIFFSGISWVSAEAPDGAGVGGLVPTGIANPPHTAGEESFQLQSCVVRRPCCATGYF